MAVNTTPIFTLTPRTDGCFIATSNLNYNGAGDLGNVIVGAAYGTKIDRITIKALVTTTAGMVRLFINDGTCRLFTEVATSAITVSNTVASFEKTLIFDRGLVLANGVTLQASTAKAENFAVIAFGGDY